MIVNNLDIKGISILPNKAHSILIVDANAVLPFAISMKRFQTLPGRYSKGSAA